MDVILYTKPGCTLCDVVKLDLLDLGEEFGFALREQNILDDDELARRFGKRIPVVALQRPGAEPQFFFAPISQIDLRRALRAATRSG